MAITTFHPQLPTTLLALEEKKPSKFSKVTSFKGWDNPFKKIALAVVHIFTALREWISKPFSKNITKIKPEKTIEATPNEIKPEPLVKREPVSKSENTAFLSSDEIVSLKAQIFTLEQCKYAKKYEEKTGKLPTEDLLIKVFNDKKIKQLNKKIDRLLEKLTPEDIEKFRARCNQIARPSENTPDQEQVSLISLPGLLGFGTGVAAGLTASTLSNYANTWIFEPIINITQTIPFIGDKITTGLQSAAFLNRGWNWSNLGLLGAKIAKDNFNSPLNKAGIITAACMAGSVGYHGIKDYIANPKKAISNESGSLIRKEISKVVNNTAVKLGRFCLTEKESDSVKQKSFNYGYSVAQKVALAVFALNVLGFNPF
jgi:hypothetical protein